MVETELAQSTQLASPQDYLAWAADRLSAAGVYCGHGTDNAWDEAATLVLYGLGAPIDAHPEDLPQQVSAKQRLRIIELLQARIDKRVPLAYLTHQAWFMQLPFFVDERVLVPRSPFAYWIEQGFSPWITDRDQIKRILDIGTGSGSLAICCALIFTKAQIDAVDISLDALEVAQQNIQHYNLTKRVQLQQSDCYAALDDAVRYDFIISNPPYVGQQYLQSLPMEYQHEPKLALEANNKGLAVCETLLRQAANFLKPSGMLWMEVGYNHEALQAAYPDLAFTWLDCEMGGEGIFMLTKKQLDDYFNDKD